MRFCCGKGLLGLEVLTFALGSRVWGLDDLAEVDFALFRPVLGPKIGVVVFELSAR